MADNKGSYDPYHGFPPLPVPPPQAGMQPYYPRHMQLPPPRFPQGHSGFALIPSHGHPMQPLSYSSTLQEDSRFPTDQLQEPGSFYHGRYSSEHCTVSSHPKTNHFRQQNWKNRSSNDHKKWKSEFNALNNDPWRNLMSQEEEEKHYEKLANKFSNVSSHCNEQEMYLPQSNLSNMADDEKETITEGTP